MTRRILAAASGGGHWQQLSAVTSELAGHEFTWLTTHENPAPDAGITHRCADADSTQPVALIHMAMRVFRVTRQVKPEVVISTGAAIGFFAVLFGRFTGAHTIWVDSLANSRRISLSGRLARHICHLHLTQWPSLADGRTTKYWGAVI